MPNMSCGSLITIFGMYLESLQIFFRIALIFLSSFVMVGKKYGTA